VKHAVQPNPVLDFGIDRDALGYVGSDLQRPECILAEPDGTLWSADARGGVVRLSPDGSQQIVTPRRSGHFQGAGTDTARYLEGTLPNGLAFDQDGNFLISNFGTDCLELMTRDGASRVLADTIDGQAIGKVNFVLRDSRNRIWITVSTRVKNWMHALRTDLADGYLARYQDGAFRIVADGNVAEREVFGPTNLGKGAWPDGIAFDSFGNLWGTLVYSDKLFVLTPEGDLRVLLDEGDPDSVETLERAFLANQVTADVLFNTGRGVAPWMASVTFGGPDLQTIYIGSLKGRRIPFFRAPVPGLPMVHWQHGRR
jgi:gluconolactonase